jgi:hypothetical protein
MRPTMDFTQWLCKCVVLQIVIDDVRVSLSLWGKIIGETRQAVHFQFLDDACMDVDKSVIRAVVEVDCPESGGVSGLPRPITEKAT